MKIKVCEKCGSSNVSSSASAVWDFDKQAWVIGDLFDNEWCRDCEGEITIESKLAPFDEAWSDEIKAEWMRMRIEGED